MPCAFSSAAFVNAGCLVPVRSSVRLVMRSNFAGAGVAAAELFLKVRGLAAARLAVSGAGLCARVVVRLKTRLLRNLGYVNVFVTALEVPSHFALTKRGAVLISETLDRPLDDFRVLRGISQVPLRHHDGVGHLAAALHRVSRTGGTFTLAAYQFEDAIRRPLKVATSAQVPDSVAVLKDREGNCLAWAIEIDQATESPGYVVEHKGKPYADLKSQGSPLLTVPDWRVVCVVPSEQRLKRLVAALWEAGIPEGQWYFAIASAICAETVLSSAWQTVRTSPNGQEAQPAMEAPLPTKAVLTPCHNGGDTRLA